MEYVRLGSTGMKVSAAVELTSDDLGEIKNAMSQIIVVGNRY